MKDQTKVYGSFLIIIAVLVIALAGEYLYFHHKLENQSNFANRVMNNQGMPPAGPNAKGRGAPIILGKGANLKTSPIFKYAYQIAPGDLSTDTKQALVGWNIKTQNQNDGSILVTLTPKDSEDQNQQYTVKSGETLYFIEQTPIDDKAGQDKDLNYRDDYGIIVDSSGIIQ